MQDKGELILRMTRDVLVLRHIPQYTIYIFYMPTELALASNANNDTFLFS